MQIPILLAANPRKAPSASATVRIRGGSWTLHLADLKDSILDLHCITPRSAPLNDDIIIHENIQDEDQYFFPHPTNVRLQWKIRGSEEYISAYLRKNDS